LRVKRYLKAGRRARLFFRGLLEMCAFLAPQGVLRNPWGAKNRAFRFNLFACGKKDFRCNPLRPTG
jgi:hypothetical protein